MVVFYYQDLSAWNISWIACRHSPDESIHGTFVLFLRLGRHNHFDTRKDCALNLTMEVRARRDEFHELYQTFHALLLTMRRKVGCRESRIYRDVNDGEVLFLSASWDDEGSLQHYMRSIGGSALLGAVDLLGETARVRMGADAAWEGIDSLKRIRKES